MSGPYCETCKFFRASMLAGSDHGQCDDRTKRVYDRNGNCMIEGPEVHAKFTCSNHAILSSPELIASTKDKP